MLLSPAMKHIEMERKRFYNRAGLYADQFNPICRNQWFIAFHGVSNLFIFHFPMQEIVQIRILLQINNITKRLFQDCPRFVPEILRGTKNIRGAGGTGDKIWKMRPCIAAGPHPVLTIEVWHQTSGGKGTNILREVLKTSTREGK